MRERKRDEIVGSISKEVSFEGRPAAVITPSFAITSTFSIDEKDASMLSIHQWLHLQR